MNEEQREERIESFRKLEENWDSYHGSPIGAEAIEVAKVFSATFSDLFVAPTTGGGVMFEDSSMPEGYGFLIDFRDDGTLDGFYIKTPKGEWEYDAETANQ